MRLAAFSLHLLVFSGVATAFLVRARWIERKVAAALVAPDADTADSSTCGRWGGSIMIIGDSRISRWPMRAFGDLPVVNKGIAGETVLQLASRFERDVLACRARSVLIAAGINDLVAASLASGDQAGEIVDRLPDRLISLAERASGAGAEVSIATIVPPSRPNLLRRLAWSEKVRAYVLTVNARLRAHAWTGAVTLVDFAAALDPQGTGTLPERFRVDTLHINETAYRVLTTLVRFAPMTPSDGAL